MLKIKNNRADSTFVLGMKNEIRWQIEIDKSVYITNIITFLAPDKLYNEL